MERLQGWYSVLNSGQEFNIKQWWYSALNINFQENMRILDKSRLQYLSHLVSAKDLLKTFLWDTLLYEKKVEKEGQLH